MGWGGLELGDRGAATGAWQAYLQVLTPSGPSGDTGAPPVPLDARLEFQTWPNLEEEDAEAAASPWLCDGVMRTATAALSCNVGTGAGCRGHTY